MSSDTALDALKSVLGDRLSVSKHDLEQHGRVEGCYSPAPPDAVAFPETAEEVGRIVEICAANDTPVIGWGAGTALEGHGLAVRGGVCVDFGRMNRVLAVNAEDMDAVVQPGLTRDELDTELRATGLFFSVDPGANASLGGMASTRASGTTTVRYGTVRDNIRALQVVLPDGRIVRTGSRARKSSSGYDLTGLFIGAEGTLGLITELTVRLHGRPESVAAAVCVFESIADAIDTVIGTVLCGIRVARIEFVDDVYAEAFNAYADAKMPAKPHLLVEFHGSTRSVEEDAGRFGELAAENGGSGFDWSTRHEERSRLWKMRHNAYYAGLAVRKGAIALTTDICVPISRLAEAIEETRADIDASPLHGPMLGHVGDGNFHTMLLVAPGDSEELRIARDLSARMAERALRLGGTVTGEHGIGVGKRDYMRAEHGEAWSLIGEIKNAMDPMNIMNPGKLVPGN